MLRYRGTSARLGGDCSLHIIVSHKPGKKGSLIRELDERSHSDYNPLHSMAADPVAVEHAPLPLGRVHANCDSENGEILATTYEKLRRLAAEYLKSERPDHTLQATALLHEAFLRVLKRPDHAWRNEGHLIAFAARAM